MGTGQATACACQCVRDRELQEDSIHKPSYPAATSFVRRHEDGSALDTARDGSELDTGRFSAVDTDNGSALDTNRTPTGFDTNRTPKTPVLAPGIRTKEDWAQDQSQFAHLPKLPDGWIRAKSRTTGDIYFCFLETGETSFTQPTGPPALPPGWVEKLSRSTGKKYYYNSQTQESQFDRPRAEKTTSVNLPAGWIMLTSVSTGRPYYFNESLQKSQFKVPTTAEG
mmetsp:Transcript_42200/g.77303  ORF Transcript_42200/g.77303 Transcript_42200/m.77303 type:complete len:225 (-) Transcript_42200:168-842(-)